MGGGAWPFLVGGLPCQVDSGNERDLLLLTNFFGIPFVSQHGKFLRKTTGNVVTRQRKWEAITGL